jgi:hypothetical protein
VALAECDRSGALMKRQSYTTHAARLDAFKSGAFPYGQEPAGARPERRRLATPLRNAISDQERDLLDERRRKIDEQFAQVCTAARLLMDVYGPSRGTAAARMGIEHGRRIARSGVAPWEAVRSVLKHRPELTLDELIAGLRLMRGAG